MSKRTKRMWAFILSVCLVMSGMYYVPGVKGEEAPINVANGRGNYTFMTSNANTPVEGFCYVGKGFSAINSCNENLSNGNNMLGTTATTDEVAIYVDLGEDYDISSALIYQGSTNSKFFDSYCTSYSIYYSTEPVTAENEGKVTWNLAGTCTNGTIYSGAKISSAEHISDSGDSITFDDTYTARSVKVVFDKDACMGTGNNGAGTGTIGTVSLLSVRVYGTKTEEEITTEDTTTDVLFIGNSMTYYNTLCKVVQGIAARKGHEINCTAATNGGQNLIYQSTAQNVLSAIREGGYETVVLQDIVGSFDADRLQTGAEAIVPIIKQYNPNANIIFYEPWPTSGTILGDNSLLPYFTYNYIQTAKSMGADLAPAGEAFYELYADYNLNYFCSDGKHPQPLGTFTSAASVYYTMYPGEAHVDFTSADQAYLDDLINDNVAYTAEGVQDTYSLETLNLIMSLGYKYSHAVVPAVNGTGTYTSVGGEYVDADAGMNPDGLQSTTGTKVNSSLFTKANGNMAVGCKAYASSEVQGASNAVDGNTGTRWESASADPQWLYVDLGTVQEVSKVGFIWEGAYASKYYVQVSNDASNWTTAAVVRASSASTVMIELDKTHTARYVRMYGTKRGTIYGYSFYEIGVWNESGEIETTTREPGSIETIAINNPAINNISGDATSRYVNFSWTKAESATKYTTYVGSEVDGIIAKAYHNNYAFDKVAQASVDHVKVTAGETANFTVIGYDDDGNVVAKGTVSVDVPALTEEEKALANTIAKISTSENLAKNKTSFVSSKTGNNIVDGNLNSNWQADPSLNPEDDPSVEYFGVNMESEQIIDTVIIAWENSYATEYDIYVAGANGVYGENPVASGKASGNNPIVVIEFDAVKAQYVKVVPTALSANAKTYGTCVYEIGVLLSGTGEIPTSNEETTNVEQETTTVAEETTTKIEEETTVEPKPELKNVANGRGNYTYLTSNANNGNEGFCYIGKGFTAINSCNENLTNGNNMLGTTATTDEVAIYVDLGADYNISRALIYQGSTNSGYFDSYCTNYSIYYSLEQVDKTNEGNIDWKLAGTCTNGTIYSGAKIKNAEHVSSSGDSILFDDTYVARSVKIVFDKESCMGTGTNGNNTGTKGTVSLLSVRVYGYDYTGEKYNVTVDDKVVATIVEGGTYILGDAKYGYYSNGKMYPAGYEYTVNEDVEFVSVNEMSVSVETGAGIRVSQPTGLRFKATVMSDKMDVVADQNVIKEGMLITANELFEENNSLLDLTTNYEKINIVNSGWYDKDGDGEEYAPEIGSFCGSIVNIKEENYIRGFIARAYVTINYVDGSSITMYSGMTGVRTVQYVAEAVKAAGYPGLSDSDIEIINSFITAK